MRASVLLTVSLTLSLVACAGEPSTDDPVEPAQEAAADAAQPGAEAGIEGGADAGLDAPGELDARDDSPTPKDASSEVISTWDAPWHDSAPDVQDAPADVLGEALDDVSIDAVVDAPADVVLDISHDVPVDAPLDGPADGMSDVAPDAPAGPVQPGVYDYQPIAAYGLVNPPAVAWHPSGAYALILNSSDKLFRFDPVSNSLAEVGAAGSTVAWRELIFMPGGDSAVVLGNTTTEGRLYRWEHASQSLTEVVSERFAGGTYEDLALSPTHAARLLGSKKITGGYIAQVWDFDTNALARGTVRAKNSSAGCQDIAWATDGFNAPALAIVCGVNGLDLLYIDGGGNFVDDHGNAGNTSRISARPQGDYALAVCWSCNSKVYRFEKGSWTADYYSPLVQGAYQVEFSTDGRRALFLGGYGGNPPVGQVYEFRHDLMTQSEFYNVSIPNFDKAPYLADSAVNLNDVAWRPGCDSGIIVGGSNTYISKKALVILFSVANGLGCSG